MLWRRQKQRNATIGWAQAQREFFGGGLRRHQFDQVIVSWVLEISVVTTIKPFPSVRIELARDRSIVSIQPVTVADLADRLLVQLARSAPK